MQKYKKQRQVLLEIGSITRVILGNMHRQLLTTLVGRPYDQCVVELRITQDILNEYQAYVKPALMTQFESINKQFKDLTVDLKPLLQTPGNVKTKK